MIAIFMKTFAMMFLMEFGDKTQIALMTSASATGSGKGHWMILAGAVCALAVSSALAVFVGAKIGEHIPKRMIQAVAGCVFVVFGVIYLKDAVVGGG